MTASRSRGMWEGSEGAVIRENVSQEQVKCHLTGAPGHMTGYIYTRMCLFNSPATISQLRQVFFWSLCTFLATKVVNCDPLGAHTKAEPGLLTRYAFRSTPYP